MAFANSAGQRLTGRTTSAQLDGIARTGSSDGSGRASVGWRICADEDAVGAEAAQRARDAADATDLEQGPTRSSSPSCVTNLLAFLAIYSFNGRAVEEGRSFAKLGEPQFDQAISLADDVTIRWRLASASTPRHAEVARRPGPRGRDHRDRQRSQDCEGLGSQSTGACHPTEPVRSEAPANLVLEPGTGSQEDPLPE